METNCIIYYHGNDWDGVPARQRYLMESLSTKVPVIFLDGSADRRGRVSRYQASDRITVIRGLVPLAETFRRRRLSFLRKPMSSWVLREIRKRYATVIFWNAENWVRPYQFVPHDLLVFDCIDPCFSENPELIAEFDRCEARVLADADLVFASASALEEDCRRVRPNVVLLNNACAPEEYAAQLLANDRRPGWWPTGNKPVVAYLGTLDWRFDFVMVEAVCRAMPEIQFVFAGNVPSPFADRVGMLSRLPNVVCPGRISVGDGRYLLANCSAGIIPFKEGAMNDRINPVKMYAYALLGKPVVGTRIRELLERPNVVRVAGTDAMFANAIREAVADSSDQARVGALKSFALENTWSERADEAWKHLKLMLGDTERQGRMKDEVLRSMRHESAAH